MRAKAVVGLALGLATAGCGSDTIDPTRSRLASRRASLA
jgi:hypothetical protein